MTPLGAHEVGATPAVLIAAWEYSLFSSRDEDPMTIVLHDDHGGVVGRVSFVAEDEPLPPAERRDGVIALYFRQSQLGEVLDLLRHGGAGETGGTIELRWDGPFDTRLSSTTALSSSIRQGGPP